jgi:ureidoglycolate lyase
MMQQRMIAVEALDEDLFAPFGWVFGGAFPRAPAAIAFSHPGSDFWHVHDFDPGASGRSEVLWVNYRNDSLCLRSLEVHWLTEQAIIPLGAGEIVHVVCPSRDDSSRLPDLERLRAFRVGAGQGVCMRPGCWHATFVRSGQTTCLMLTRASTTRDLIAGLNGESAAAESSSVELASLGPDEYALMPA